MGRIVINVEPGKRSVRRRPRRRWPRIIASLALLVVAVIAVALVGGFLWWRHYQSTPTYSLALLVDAAQRSDVDELAKRIDDDEVIRNMIGRVSQKTSERYGLAMTAAIKQQIEQVVSSSSSRLRQTIHDEVTKEIKSLGSGSEPKPFVFLLITMPSLVTITTEGNVARAAATISNRTLEVMMRRDGDRWKLVEFNDERVVHRVVDSIMTELPAIGAFDSSPPLIKNPGRSRKRRR